MHKEGELKEIYNNNTLSSVNHDIYDVRLKENFKVFISGPLRCGKTVFVSNLLEKINKFAKIPPTRVIYVYKVWQPKYDEMLSLGVNFKVNHGNIVDDIKYSVTGEPTLIIFDDLIGSSSLNPTMCGIFFRRECAGGGGSLGPDPLSVFYVIFLLNTVSVYVRDA